MLENVKRYLRHTNWPIVATMLTLMVFGVLAIRVTERADPSIPDYTYARRQIAYACAGLVMFVAVTLVPYPRFGRAAYVLFALTLGLLVLVFFLPPIRGSRRWIDLKILQVQPSEIAKLAFIVLLAWYLRFGDHYRRLRGLIVPFVLTFVPMGLILKEPDLGTSLLFLPTLYIMLFMAGAKLRHLLGIVVVATALLFVPAPRRVTSRMGPAEQRDRKALCYWTAGSGDGEYIVSAAAMTVMEHHQVKRIEGWLRQSDPAVARDKGFHYRQSKMVLGAGGLTGGGRAHEINPYSWTLPDDHTDFIFSVVGGQWGFLGCAALLFLYGVILVFGVEIAVITYDPFGRLLAVGVLALLFTQVVINVGMTMGLMPITGMTLPLISYGGSSLVINCAALGLLVNVGQRRPILLGKRPFEHGPKKEKPPAPYGPLGDGSGADAGSVSSGGGWNGR